MQLEYLANSTDETEHIASELAKKLDTGGAKRAFIALWGEMGVGKTAFVRGFSAYFGAKGVKSPTYTVVNEYSARVTIYHFDMYRLEDEDDLWSIGYEDYVNRDAFVLCEWSENIADLLPDDRIDVIIERVADSADSRTIKINIPEICLK